MSEGTGLNGRRFSDEMLFRLDERVRLHLEWAEANTKAVSDRLKTLEDWKSSIEQPVRYAGMIIVTLIVAFVGAIGTWIWKLLTRMHLGP